MFSKTGTPSLAIVPSTQRRQPSRSRRVLDALHSRGLTAANVRRNRHTGVYAVRFGAADVTNMASSGTEPAHEWAQRIRESFDGVEIVDTYDTVADWRPQRPVLFATVLLRGELKPKAS